MSHSYRPDSHPTRAKSDRARTWFLLEMSRLIADFRDSELDPIEKASTLLHIAGDAERAWLRVLTSAGLIPAGREHLNHGEL